MKKTTIILAAVLAAVFFFPLWGGLRGAFSQDIHFSQYTQTPLLLNPAQTGVYNERKMIIDNRVIANYKTQWQSLTKYPYRTFAISYDRTFLKNSAKANGGYLGGGITAFTDKAGMVKISNTHFKVNISGIVPVGDGNTIAAGLNGGIVLRALDPSSAQ